MIKITTSVFKIMALGIKNLPFNQINLWVFFALWFVFVHLLINKGYHLHVLKYYLSMFIHNRELCLSLVNNLLLQKLFVGISMIWILIFLAGLSPYLQRKRLQLSLDKVDLHNGLREKPKVIDVIDESEERTKVLISNHGVGLKNFESRRDDLEASLGEKIEAITNEISPRVTTIVFNRSNLPKLIKYKDFSGVALAKDNFVVGKSNNGIVTQSITELPHMLIAGSTGSGKSIFFKQAIMTLMKSCDHVQVFLLDLKSGIEMQDFSKFPNTTIVKDISSAVVVLNKIKSEMDRRFSYLEKNGYREIIPERDKMDRILVCIDECSVLYAKRNNRFNPKDLSVEAVAITDSLAKLSRASAMNLILATQKVSKDTIDTHIQENISGKLCFKTNTLQGSLTVLGNGSACNLPDHPGRAIWHVGNKYIEVQTPLITSSEIKEFGEKLLEDFQNGRRSIYQNKLMAETSEEVAVAIEEDN
ncbi:MAG: hypothetical protein HQK49_09135 [Oligoflexia bacterium]|nr:hypothetical protein [Oligoflexia bacterium]